MSCCVTVHYTNFVFNHREIIVIIIIFCFSIALPGMALMIQIKSKLKSLLDENDDDDV